jgi:hypothetical protein
MILLQYRLIAPLFTLATITASEVVYVIDLPAYASLAPCAASAISYNFDALTESNCPEAVTALESCACTKDQNSAAVLRSIDSSVSYMCGGTATDDISSASVVFASYCNQDAAAQTTTASQTTAASGTASGAAASVSQYITELSAYSDLAPCAASGLSYVLDAQTEENCPPGASALASCACSKNQNSLDISRSIRSSVFYECGSTHTEDATSAQAIFAGYCGLGAGSSVFPTVSFLPGAVTYYVTDLPQYTSLAPCAASAVSYVFDDATENYCPADSKALASCACVKDQNSIGISSAIAKSVDYYCGSTASEDVTSAVGVFGYYCSAGNGLVTPTGVTASGKNLLQNLTNIGDKSTIVF